MEVICRARAFCQEFTDFVLCDEKRNSMVINIDTQYFAIVVRELKRYGYKLIFTTNFSHNKTLTCAFISCLHE